MTWVMAGRLMCALIAGADHEPVVALAARLAGALHLDLALADVRAPAPLVPVPPAPGAAVVADVADLAMVEPPTDLAALAAGAGSDPVELLAVAGEPAAKLAELSEIPSTAVLLAADSGGGAAWSWFTQAPARGALRQVACPTMLVAHAARALDTGISNVIAAVCDDPAALRVTSFAATLANALNASIDLVHSTAEDPPTTSSSRLLADCERLLPVELDVRMTVAPEDIGDLVARIAGERTGSVVVMGQPERGLVGSAVHGSAVHDLLASEVAPVVVVPRPVQGGDEAPGA